MDGKTVKIIKNVLPVTLDKPTQKLVELIFSQNMFKEAMECMNLGRCVRYSVVNAVTEHFQQTCGNGSLATDGDREAPCHM